MYARAWAPAVGLPPLAHLRRLLVPAGVTQFSECDSPDARSGTCSDDNARALLVAVLALAVSPHYEHAREIGDAAIGFLERAQRPDGRFRNMADIEGEFLEELGSEDSIGRTAWACGVTARCAAVPAWRESALKMLVDVLPALPELRSLQSRAYALLGLTAAVAPNTATAAPATPVGGSPPRDIADRLVSSLNALADALAREFEAYADDTWAWWVPELTWGNARMPDAMLNAALVTGKSRLADVGLRSLRFLAAVTQAGDVFVPIGNDGWYRRGERRAIYDQQPIEVCGMVDAWLAAFRLTGESRFVDRARTAFEWFEGRNTEGLRIADPETGGCCDGLRRGSLNRNQGAESTLSYLHAALSMQGY